MKAETKRMLILASRSLNPQLLAFNYPAGKATNNIIMMIATNSNNRENNNNISISMNIVMNIMMLLRS